MENRWLPFRLGQLPRPRSLSTPQGLGDRLRLVAFAERQASHAFLEAAERFIDSPPELREAWRWIAKEETKHETWLLARLKELQQEVAAVPVQLDLYHSFERCQSGREFAIYMASAEERGRIAGERFAAVLAELDPVTADVFRRIALEEREHVALVARFFPDVVLEP